MDVITSYTDTGIEVADSVRSLASLPASLNDTRGMNTILIIDIAHPPLDGAEAEAALNEALKKIHLSAKLRVLKIIHGYGSTGKGGVLKTVVKDWAYSNRKRIKCVIDGEGISTFDLDVLELAAECDLSVKDDLGVANEGTTIVWIK